MDASFPVETEINGFKGAGVEGGDWPPTPGL